MPIARLPVLLCMNAGHLAFSGYRLHYLDRHRPSGSDTAGNGMAYGFAGMAIFLSAGESALALALTCINTGPISVSIMLVTSLLSSCVGLISALPAASFVRSLLLLFVLVGALADEASTGVS